MASKISQTDLVIYGGNIAAGLTVGLGSPFTAIASGIERLVEGRNPSLGRNPFVRVPEVVAAGFSAYSALMSIPVVVHSIANGHLGKACLYLVSGILSGAMAARLGVKLEHSYGGGLGSIVGGTIDDTTYILGRARDEGKKLLK